MAIDFNKPVQTRDGRKVRVLCTDAKGRQPVIALVLAPQGHEEAHRWGLDGRFWLKEHAADELDLINAPERVERWLGHYGISGTGCEHESRKAADEQASVGRIAVLRITYEDGKPVSVALEDV